MKVLPLAERGLFLLAPFRPSSDGWDPKRSYPSLCPEADQLRKFLCPWNFPLFAFEHGKFGVRSVELRGRESKPGSYLGADRNTIAAVGSGGPGPGGGWTFNAKGALFGGDFF